MTKVALDLGGHLGGVVTHRGDEARVPSPQEAKADDIEAGRRRDPTGMDDLARRIEHRNMQPAIVPTETCRPDNRPDVVGRKIEGSGRGIERKTGRPGLGGRPDSIGDLSMRLSTRSMRACEPATASARLLFSVSDPVLNTGNAADQADTDVAQHTKVEIAPLGPADQLYRRLRPGTRRSAVRGGVIFQDAIPSSHHMMSRPRYSRGSRVWRPTEIVTCRPERWISSASCTPEAEAPTTSTPPSGNSPGLR